MAFEISILCALDAQPWAQYVQQKLSEKKYNCSLTVKTLSQSGTLDDANSKEHKEAQVQVLMLSPDFLRPFEEADRVDSLPDYSPLFPRQRRSVVVFCGFAEDDTDMQRIMSVQFRNFNKWAKCSAGLDEQDVQTLILTIVRVLEEETSNGTDSGFPEEDIYSIPPQPRSLEQKTFTIVPEQITALGTKLYIIFNDSVTSPVTLQLNNDLHTEVIAQEENPFTFSFIIPEGLKLSSSRGEHVVKVYANEVEIGTGKINVENTLDCLSRLLTSVMNPVDLIGQSMGISNASQNISGLDLKLKELFQSNLPSINLQEIFRVSSGEGEIGAKCSKEAPTIIHFAAKFGLKELCAELLTCPGATQSLTLENSNGELPNDIAERAGHKDLATFLTDYMFICSYNVTYDKKRLLQLICDTYFGQHTGVPIEMMYDEAVSRRKKSLKKDAASAANMEAPPAPCRGGSYFNADEKDPRIDSVYIDMSKALGKPEYIREISIQEEEGETTVSQTSVEPKTEGGQERTSPQMSPTCIARIAHKPPSLRGSTSSASSSSINQYSRSSGSRKKSINSSKESSPVQSLEVEDQERSRSTSESAAEYGVMKEEERDTFPTLPPPFNPGPPLSAKDISSVSITTMSNKDQALRLIIQSAAEGMVSIGEAKRLVDNWSDQYRRQPSFKDRWKTIHQFQPTTMDETDSQPLGSPTKTKKSKFNFSKIFKRKTRSHSDLSLDNTSKKTLTLGNLSPSHNAYTEGVSRRDLSSTSPNNNNKEDFPACSSSPLKRAKSIRISHAMQDKDFTNLPDLPARSNRHDKSNRLHGSKSSQSPSQGQVGRSGANPGGQPKPPVQTRPESAMKEGLFKQVSAGTLSDLKGSKQDLAKKPLPRSSSDGSHFKHVLGQLGEPQTSPRLPEPDIVPSSK